MEMTRRVPARCEAGVLDGVFEEEEDARYCAGVALVDQDGALFEQVAVARQRAVDDGVEQRMAGTDEGGGGLAAVGDQRLFEGDAFVAAQHVHAGADGPLDVAQRGGHVGDLVAAVLALAGASAHALEGFQKKGLDVVGAGGGGPRRVPCGRGCDERRWCPLCPASASALRADSLNFSRSKAFSTVVVSLARTSGCSPVADGFDQQFAQRPAVELHFAEHVENLSAEGLARPVPASPGAVRIRRPHGYRKATRFQRWQTSVWPMRWIRPKRCSRRLGFQGRS